jgi:hypothetical protein
LKNVVDVHKTTQNNKTLGYYQIKEDVKAKYEIEELDEIECI